MQSGRLLTYPSELDDELLKVIFVLMDLHFPVSIMSLQEKAKLVIQPHKVGLENFSTDTNLLYVPVLRPAKNFQSNWKVFLANSMKTLHI